MTRFKTILISSALAVIIAGCTTTPEQEEFPYVWPADAAVSKKLKEWQNWKFGVIIHWGPYSQWGVVESWSLCPEDEPWCVRRGPFAVNYYTYTLEYEKIREVFNPVCFNPGKWAEACSNAGMKYVVFTTKHHDGFCMFDTKYTDYKITGPASIFSSDPRSNIVNEVFNAFREKDMGIGAYFSKPDWHNDNYWCPYFPVYDRNVNYDPAKYPEKWKEFQQFTFNQLEELTTGYGKLDILWLDGGWVRPDGTLTEETRPWLGRNQWVQDINIPAIAEMARKNQPGLLIVDRTVHGEFENYRTPEQQVPETAPDYPWESCITLGDNWYSTGPDENYKSSAWAIHTLIKIVSRGGNFLLGIGPDKTGELVPEVYTRLEEIGNWMDINASSIYNTKPLPPYQEGKFCFTVSSDGATVFASYLKDENEKFTGKLELPETFAENIEEVKLLGYSENLRVIYEKGVPSVIIPEEYLLKNVNTPALVFCISREPIKK